MIKAYNIDYYNIIGQARKEKAAYYHAVRDHPTDNAALAQYSPIPRSTTQR